MTFDVTGLMEKRNLKGTRYFESKDSEIEAKECTKCEKVRGIREYHRHEGGLGGKKSRCTKCESRRRHKYYINNRKKVAETVRRYRIKNHEKMAEYYKKYREDNRDKRSDYNRKHYEENREHYRKYREMNQDKISKYYKKYREDNRERFAEYRYENRERIAKNKAKYHQENPHIVRMAQARRRARIRQLPDDLTHEQEASILGYFGGACALSGDTGDSHLDHVIPVSIGHGGTIYENMIPLRADLNMSKHARNIFDWFADNRERLGLEQRKFDELIEYLAEINGMTTKEYEEYVRWCHDNPRDLVGKSKEGGAS